MAGISRQATERLNAALLAVALIGLLVGGVALLYRDSVGHRNVAWLQLVRQVEDEALKAGRQGDDVSQGLLPDYALLATQRESFDKALQALHAGDADAGSKPLPAAVSAELEAVDASWQKMKESMTVLLDGSKKIATVSENLHVLETSTRGVTAAYHDALTKLVSAGSSSYLVGAAGQQIARGERLAYLSRCLLGNGLGADAVASEIGDTAKSLASTHVELGGEGPVGAIIKTASPAVAAISESAGKISARSEAIINLQGSAAELSGQSRDLNAAATALEHKLDESGPPGLRGLVIPALVVAVLSLFVYVGFNMVSVRGRMRRAEENDSKQQTAILGLLDEISNLADGDLTVRANVTADFTGAIADSVNYTVETLRSLVGTINQTAVEISAAATSTSETAEAMQSASDSQALEVVEITRQVTSSSESLSAVAARAEQLARSATESVNVAHNGASTVGRTIQGMAALREQIQDTSKRIKRLGESSQEIGNIIEFINDIAEQTNTLALNASIQAAMAGESGRGFAVVADEVQRLAERAAAATRQIETLVKTIQADTNEAIVSMERSTTNVISGARSAEEAGQALTRIESSSNDLARLIQEISTQARAEAAVASRITGQMQVVREAAMSTASSAQVTASAVGELNALSGKLRDSVAGFRLPTDVSLDEGADFGEPSTAR